MSDLARRLATLSSAEDFLEFFGVPFEPSVVHVNRLHILKRFHQYMRAAQDMAGMNDVDRFRNQRELLARAYGDFVRSTPQQEKVFPVFHRAQGTQHFALDRLRKRVPA